jgi:4-hydroxy-tetrahydrodipicolinate synthase
MFKGSNTALITPFADGKVDETALRNLIEWQIFAGIIARGTDDGR